MEERQPINKPVILLFDEYGKPLLVRNPFYKREIGFGASIKEHQDG